MYGIVSVLVDVTDTWFGVDVANITGSEPVSWAAFTGALELPFTTVYRHRMATIKRPINAEFKEYYHFCMRGNVVAHVQELTSQYPRDCMQFRFSEPFLSRNARIWDIQIPVGFYINITVIDH